MTIVLEFRQTQRCEAVLGPGPAGRRVRHDHKTSHAHQRRRTLDSRCRRTKAAGHHTICPLAQFITSGHYLGLPHHHVDKIADAELGHTGSQKGTSSL